MDQGVTWALEKANKIKPFQFIKKKKKKPFKLLVEKTREKEVSSTTT